MTTPPQTRHVTLCVTHPGGDGHLTLDHHIPAQAADDLVRVVRAASVPGGGRYLSVFTTDDDGMPVEPCVPTDNATADFVIATMRDHMPQRTFVELLADASRHLRAGPAALPTLELATEIDAALTYWEETP